jgi:hypothetical protein
MSFIYASAAVLLALVIFLRANRASQGRLMYAPSAQASAAPVREKYGPPPGVRRALSHEELPDSRGWLGLDRAYEASTASAISHMIERSA